MRNYVSKNNSGNEAQPKETCKENDVFYRASLLCDLDPVDWLCVIKENVLITKMHDKVATCHLKDNLFFQVKFFVIPHSIK